MREIEFRGKTSSGRWLYGDFRHGWSDESPSGYITQDHKYVMVKKETVGQYIGLKDKNGKRIFEGDVVEMKCSINTNLTGVVMFVNEAGCYAVYREDGYGLFVTDARFFRLLGNIFDDENFHQRFWPVWQKGSLYLISKLKGTHQ